MMFVLSFNCRYFVLSNVVAPENVVTPVTLTFLTVISGVPVSPWAFVAVSELPVTLPLRDPLNVVAVIVFVSPSIVTVPCPIERMPVILASPLTHSCVPPAPTDPTSN